MHLLLALFLLLKIPLFATICDINLAFKMSKKEARPLLIYFTDSHLNGDVLEAKEFVDVVTPNFVFAKIDFSTLSLEEREVFASKFLLGDLPRLILLDEKGDELGRYGIYGETPESIARELIAIVARRDALESSLKDLNVETVALGELEDLYKKALELNRREIASSLLDLGLQKDSLFFLIEKYRLLSENGSENERKAIRKKALQLDPRNEKETFFSLALIDFQTLSKKGGGRGAVEPLEAYLEKYGEKDHKNRWRLEMMISQFYLNFDEWNASLKHAEIAVQEAPPDKRAELSECRDYIKEQLSYIADRSSTK